MKEFLSEIAKEVEHNLINLDENDKKLYSENVSHLITIIKTKGDNNVKRSVSYMLQHLSKDLVVYILTDNLESFKKLELKMDSYELLSSFLNTAICKSKFIFEYSYEKYSEFKEHHYLISYAICSRDAVWVSNLIEKLSINVNDHKYCFWLYADRMGMTEVFKNQYSGMYEKYKTLVKRT